MSARRRKEITLHLESRCTACRKRAAIAARQRSRNTVGSEHLSQAAKLADVARDAIGHHLVALDENERRIVCCFWLGREMSNEELFIRLRAYPELFDVFVCRPNGATPA